jgi:hypothetical protein
MFKDAADRFSERSIDIIHIDGLHTYEAVKDDFEMWKNKLKEDGTIIFHDWNVREKGFGVWKLWHEITMDPTYKCIQTPNGYGLGIATFSKIKPSWHDEIQKHLPMLIAKGKLLKEIQDKEEKIEALEKEKSLLGQHSKNLESIKQEHIKHIESLKINLEEAKSLNRRLQHEINQCKQSLERKLITKFKKLADRLKQNGIWVKVMRMKSKSRRTN